MTSDTKLSNGGHHLHAQLTAAFEEKKKADEVSSQTINVAGVGSMVSAAYEQLRNAAEYAQEHLLIQNAIRRFFVRNLFILGIDRSISEELVIELTQAGYIKNNTQPQDVIDRLYEYIKQNYDNYHRLKISGISEKSAKKWVLDLLSVGCEDIMVKNYIQPIYLQFAYQHYHKVLKKHWFASSVMDEANFEASMYVAIHRSLFESDLAEVRYDMHQLYKISDNNINEYAQFNENIDNLFTAEMTNKIVRYINRYGAPLRILRSMIKDNDKFVELLSESDRFNNAYLDQVKKEYKLSKSKLNKGLIKSLIFLVITKALIGLAIEIPYDMMLTGAIMMTPLLVNLFTPVVYLSLLRMGFRLPGKANSTAMQTYVDGILYGDQENTKLYPVVKDKKYPVSFTITYIFLFLIVFALAAYLLGVLGFNIVNGTVFFIFLATASFLGFRLSRIVRKLELIEVRQGPLSTTRELIFTPFALLGKWLTDKYQKVNIVALILDTVIELPLKTTLRLVRQWMGFLSEKTDQL